MRDRRWEVFFSLHLGDVEKSLSCTYITSYIDLNSPLLHKRNGQLKRLLYSIKISSIRPLKTRYSQNPASVHFNWSLLYIVLLYFMSINLTKDNINNVLVFQYSLTSLPCVWYSALGPLVPPEDVHYNSVLKKKLFIFLKSSVIIDSLLVFAFFLVFADNRKNIEYHSLILLSTTSHPKHTHWDIQTARQLRLLVQATLVSQMAMFTPMNPH